MDSTGKLTATPAPAARQGLWLAVVVLTALNLRPFLTAVGPLAHDIAAATGLDLRGMAWLTLLPMLLMGLGAWCGPALQQRLGARRVLLGALVVLAAGSALRAWSPRRRCAAWAWPWCRRCFQASSSASFRAMWRR